MAALDHIGHGCITYRPARPVSLCPPMAPAISYDPRFIVDLDPSEWFEMPDAHICAGAMEDR